MIEALLHARRDADDAAGLHKRFVAAYESPQRLRNLEVEARVLDVREREEGLGFVRPDLLRGDRDGGDGREGDRLAGVGETPLRGRT